MSLRENEFAQRTGGAIEIRSDPLRAQWHFTDLPSADAHTINAHFSCSLRIVENPADQKLFAEIFLTAQDRATIETLTNYFARPLKSAITNLAAECKAADVIGGRYTWIPTITSALKPAAFAAGVEFLPPFHLDIESPTVQQQKLREISHTRAIALGAAQLEHLQHAAELLKQFESMRESAPQLSAAKILDQLAPADRGKMLQSLLLANSDKTKSRTLWAVAGSYLIKLDARAEVPSPELIDLPTTLGPLRSVQLSGEYLLIGAQTGVMRAPAKNPREVQIFQHPDLRSQTGFNGAIATNENLFATHSEAGVVVWNLNDATSPPKVHADAGARNLQILHASRILYSAANELILRTNESRTILPSQSLSQIISIVPHGQTILIIHQDGTLISLDRVSC